MALDLTLLSLAPAAADPHALQAALGLTEGLGFFTVMTAAGYALGKAFGDDFALLPAFDRAELGGARDEDLRTQLDALADTFRAGSRPEGLPAVLSILEGRDRLHYATFPDAVDAMVRIYAELAPVDEGGDPGLAADLETLFGVLGVKGDRELSIRIISVLCRKVATHRRAADPLIDMSVRHPIIWNYAEAPLEAAAVAQPTIRRLLDERAGPTQKFIRHANEAYSTDLVRFRRLAADHAKGHQRVVFDELDDLLRREFAFLHHAGFASRRFGWLASEAPRIHDLYDDTRLAIVEHAARSGVPGTSALLAKLILLWNEKGLRTPRVDAMLDALCEGSLTYVNVADALVQVFRGTREGSPGEAVRNRTLNERSWHALMASADASFEVIKLMSTHGIPTDLYPRVDA